MTPQKLYDHSELCDMLDEDGLPLGPKPCNCWVGDIERLQERNAELYQYLRDTSDGMECLPECDSIGHADECPVTEPMATFRRLRERIAELEAALTTLGAKEVSVIRAEERERCAQVCDTAASVEGIAQDCARMIRNLEGE